MKNKILGLMGVLVAFILLNGFTTVEAKDVTSDNSGTNSWWVYPLAVTSKKDKDITYISFTDQEGYSGVIAQNQKTGKLQKVRVSRPGIDDHNAGAVEVMDDGRIMYVVTGHNVWNYLEVHISVNPYDITKWREPIKVKMDARASYAQLLKTEEGYLLFSRQYKRRTATTKSDWSWVVSSSKDGVKWDKFHTVLNSGTMQYYLKAMPCTDTTNIRLVMYSNPNAKDTRIRLGFYNPTNKKILNGTGKKIAKATTKGVGASYSKFKVIVEENLGKKGTINRLLDVAITPQRTTKLAVASFADYTNATYRIATYNSNFQITTYKKIGSSGSAFYYKSKYFGGVVFDLKNPSNVYISRKVGATWRIEQWKEQKTKYSRVRLLYKSKFPSIRPFATKGGSTIQFATGRYNPKSYKDSQMKLLSLKKFF